MKVTAIIKYDIYPYYLVLEGDLNEEFDVLTKVGRYSAKNLLAVKSLSEFTTQKQKLEDIRRQYREKEKELRLALLEENGVDFVKIE